MLINTGAFSYDELYVINFFVFNAMAAELCKEYSAI